MLGCIYSMSASGIDSSPPMLSFRKLDWMTAEGRLMMNIISDSDSHQEILLPAAQACPDCLPLSHLWWEPSHWGKVNIKHYEKSPTHL